MTTTNEKIKKELEKKLIKFNSKLISILDMLDNLSPDSEFEFIKYEDKLESIKEEISNLAKLAKETDKNIIFELVNTNEFHAETNIALITKK